MKRLSAFFARYIANADPLAHAGNLVAVLIGTNQPLYPLALYWATGADVTGAFICFLSAPCFLAVPFIARRSSLAGRLALVLVGTFDTLISVKVYGQAGGNELYLGPCLMLAVMLFRKSEWRVSFGCVALIWAALFGLHDRYGASVLGWSAGDYATMMSFNVFYVAMLTVFIALGVGRARGEGGQ